MKTCTTNQIVRLQALAGLALLFVAACGQAVEPPAPEPEPAAQVAESKEETEDESGSEERVLTFVDDLGRTVALNGYPERIVTMAPSMTETLFALGAGDTVVGRDDFSVYPQEVSDIPSFGSLFADFPAEAILGMEPDLVLAAQVISAEQVQALEDLGLVVYWQANPNSFDELYANMLEIAALVDKGDEAAVLVADLESRVDAVLAAVTGIDEPPVVFYELDGTDPSNPWTSGRNTFIDLIITSAGGMNAGATLEGSFAQMSVEALIEQDPDFIILGDSDFGITPEMVSARGGWDVMTAVVNGDIYPFDSNLISVPGPRLVDGLEQVARILHPDLFD